MTKIQPYAIMLLACLIIGLGAPAASVSAAQPARLRPVQVFDVAEGKVVKTIENDAQFQQFAAGWLGSVTGLSPQLKPEDKCGHVFRVPLGQPITVRTQGLEVSAAEVFLFYCPQKPSVLLVFDPQRKPYIFTFNADVKPFLRKVGLPS